MPPYEFASPPCPPHTSGECRGVSKVDGGRHRRPCGPTRSVEVGERCSLVSVAYPASTPAHASRLPPPCTPIDTVRHHSLKFCAGRCQRRGWEESWTKADDYGQVGQPGGFGWGGDVHAFLPPPPPLPLRMPPGPSYFAPPLNQLAKPTHRP